MIKAALIFFCALMACARPSMADGPGYVTLIFYGGNAEDPRPCTFFQSNGGNQWYAIRIRDESTSPPTGDLGYPSELLAIKTAKRDAMQVSFAAGAVDFDCGFPTVYALWEGVSSTAPESAAASVSAAAQSLPESDLIAHNERAVQEMRILAAKAKARKQRTK